MQALINFFKNIYQLMLSFFKKMKLICLQALLTFFKKNKKRIVSHPYFIRLSNLFSSFINKYPLLKSVFHSQKRSYFLFLAMAFLISLFLFYCMSFITSSGKNPKMANNENVNIEFLMNNLIDELELRSRRLLKKPEAEEPPPETPQIKTQPTELEKPTLSSSLPQLELPEDYSSDEQGALVSGQGVQDSMVTPVFRINPIYPRKAAMQNIEGFVILQFDITKTGQVDNILVVRASPPQIFNSNAVQALRKWKYKPRIEEGQPVRQKNLRVQLDFKLTD